MNAPFKLYTDEELAPFLDLERAKEDAKRRHHAREAEKARGLSSYIEPPVYRSDEQIMMDAIAAADARRAFRNSPRGRFSQAMYELEQTGFAYEAEQARSCWRRGFYGAGDPINPAEIGACLLILNGIDVKAAAEGRDALGELLLSCKREAA